MKKLLSRYRPNYINALVYMLQNSQYKAGDYLTWFWRTSDFDRVIYRKKLILTRKANILRWILWVIVLVVVSLVIFIFAQGIWISLLLLPVLPWILALLIVPLLWTGDIFIQKPREQQLMKDAQKIIQNHQAIKIAIAGSYGKTTAKQILLTVLSEAKIVAATPGNQNTVLGISRFAQKLTGDEEILIFELGESHVGDIKQLAELTQPDMGIITGVNEAHLKTFKTIERTVATIFELEDYLQDKPLYKNVESDLVRTRVSSKYLLGFSRKGVGGWQVKNTKTDLHGTTFDLQRDNHSISVKIGLPGLHIVGIVSAVVAVATGLGLSNKQIQTGLAKLQPVEHRMQPRFQYGAWIIDDTYNGNIEGVEVGLALLKDLKAKRRIYVTPGLVEQGAKSQQIHHKIGSLAAKVADEVVLMKNSTTDDIVAGLKEAKFTGKLSIIDDPLSFYINLDQVVAKGDVVLMQNDWTDNYH